MQTRRQRHGFRGRLRTLGVCAACALGGTVGAQSLAGGGRGQDVSRDLTVRIVIPPVLHVELGRRQTSSDVSTEAAPALALRVFTHAQSLNVSAESGGGDSVSVFSATTRRHPKAPAAGLHFAQTVPSAPMAATQEASSRRTVYAVSTP